jgi:hypothetical protein
MSLTTRASLLRVTRPIRAKRLSSRVTASLWVLTRLAISTCVGAGTIRAPWRVSSDAAPGGVTSRESRLLVISTPLTRCSSLRRISLSKSKHGLPNQDTSACRSSWWSHWRLMPAPSSIHSCTTPSGGGYRTIAIAALLPVPGPREAPQ